MRLLGPSQGTLLSLFKGLGHPQNSNVSPADPAVKLSTHASILALWLAAEEPTSNGEPPVLPTPLDTVLLSFNADVAEVAVLRLLVEEGDGWNEGDCGSTVAFTTAI